MENNKELKNTLQELVIALEMSNLAELRNLVNRKYEIERNKILRDTVQYLKDHSDTEYTAAELTNGTGLSVRSMVSGLRYRTASVEYEYKKVPIRYVRLDKNGNADFSHIITFHKTVGVYSYKKDKRY